MRHLSKQFHAEAPVQPLYNDAHSVASRQLLKPQTFDPPFSPLFFASTLSFILVCPAPTASCPDKKQSSELSRATKAQDHGFESYKCTNSLSFHCIAEFE